MLSMGKDFCYRQRMAAKILRKILSSLITLLVLSLVVWALVRFLPADRAALIAGDTVVGPTSLVIEEKGWFQWISDVIHLDFGTSTFGGEAISTLVWQRMGAASALMISSVIVALVIALVVTAVALIRPSRFTRGIANSLSSLSMCLPSFVIAMALTCLFALHLGLLPSGGYVPPREDFFGFARSLVLPALSLGFTHSGLYIRALMQAYDRQLSKGYMLQARAEGEGRAALVLQHSWRAVLPELVTLVCQSVPTMLVSSAALESVFSYPGLGSLTVAAIARRDSATITALVLLGAVTGVITSTLDDIVQGLCDRRHGHEDG